MNSQITVGNMLPFRSLGDIDEACQGRQRSDVGGSGSAAKNIFAKAICIPH